MGNSRCNLGSSEQWGLGVTVGSNHCTMVRITVVPLSPAQAWATVHETREWKAGRTGGSVLCMARDHADGRRGGGSCGVCLHTRSLLEGELWGGVHEVTAGGGALG